MISGMICGLELSDGTSVDNLAISYLATIQAIAYGTRHIIEEMNKKGFRINSIFITGGSAQNSVFVREHADICKCKIVIPVEVNNAVLLGAAVLGAVASGSNRFQSIFQAMNHMNKVKEVIEPEGPSSDVTRYHNAKYTVYTKMYQHQREYRALMQAS